MAINSISLTEDTANKGAVNGYCGLNASQEIYLYQIPDSVKKKRVFIRFESKKEEDEDFGMKIGDVDTWSSSGIEDNKTAGVTLPFNGTFISVKYNIGAVDYDSAPPLINNNKIEFTFKKEFWTNGGIDLAPSFLIPLGADINNSSGFQEIGSTGKGTGSLGLNISGLEGQMIGLKFESNNSDTIAKGIGNCDLVFEYEEL